MHSWVYSLGFGTPSSQRHQPRIVGYPVVGYTGRVIQSWGDPATEHIFFGEETKQARTIPKALWPVVRRKLFYVHAAATIADLRQPPGNRLEALKGSRRGQYSIRVNDQYRITLRFDAGHAWEVRCEDYHS